MYHSVTFGSKNSYSDWHLVPDSRPVIVMPEQKKEVVDIPGGNGVIDLSMALTKFPIFNRRSGDLTFHVLNGYGNWKDLYEEIAAYLHGQKLNMWLEDDPNFYYTGYFSVAWTSNNDGTWSDITISYDLEPYKYSRSLVYMSDAFTLKKNTNGYNPSAVINGATSLPITLPTPLILEISNVQVNPKLAVGFKNSLLSIDDEATYYNTTTNQYETKHLITSSGTHTLKQYPICGKTSSDMYSLKVRFDISSISTTNGAAMTIRVGYRRALL